MKMNTFFQQRKGSKKGEWKSMKEINQVYKQEMGNERKNKERSGRYDT